MGSRDPRITNFSIPDPGTENSIPVLQSLPLTTCGYLHALHARVVISSPHCMNLHKILVLYAMTPTKLFSSFFNPPISQVVQFC